MAACFIHGCHDSAKFLSDFLFCRPWRYDFLWLFWDPWCFQMFSKAFGPKNERQVLSQPVYLLGGLRTRTKRCCCPVPFDPTAIRLLLQLTLWTGSLALKNKAPAERVFAAFQCAFLCSIESFNVKARSAWFLYFSHLEVEFFVNLPIHFRKIFCFLLISVLQVVMVPAPWLNL